MKISVMDRFDAARQHDNFDFVISLFDMNFYTEEAARKLFNNRAAHVVEFFDDDHYATRYSPRIHNLNRILDLFRELKCPSDNNILIHCHAGISRSTALAIILYMEFDGCSIADAYEEVYKVRPVMSPNSILIELYDCIKNADGKYVEYNELWRERFK